MVAKDKKAGELEAAAEKGALVVCGGDVVWCGRWMDGLIESHHPTPSGLNVH